MALRGAGAWGTQYRYRPDRPVVGLRTDGSFDQLRINLAVLAVQKRLRVVLNTPDVVPDGQYGPKTADFCKWFQATKGRDVVGAPDGWAGYRTCNALFKGLARWYGGLYQIPWPIMGHLCRYESVYDPGAQGYLTPRDLGLIQVNSKDQRIPTDPGVNGYHDVTIEQAFDADFNFDWGARRMRDSRNSWGDWTAAVLAHNSPAAAQYYVDHGRDEVPLYPLPGRKPVEGIHPDHWRRYVGFILGD